MKYKNESRKKFEEALSEAWKYIGPINFNLNNQGEYEDKDVQQVWEGWFLRFQATYEPPKPKPRYHIEYLESEHECTCGDCVYTSAYGYKIYKDGESAVEKIPVSSCEKYLDFGDCFPYYDICELEKIQISEENGYE